MIRCWFDGDVICFSCPPIWCSCSTLLFEYYWFTLDVIRGELLLTREGEGLINFIVTYRHQTPNLELQLVLKCERFIVDTAIIFIWKELWPCLVAEQKIVTWFVFFQGQCDSGSMAEWWVSSPPGSLFPCPFFYPQEIQMQHPHSVCRRCQPWAPCLTYFQT